MASHRAGVAIFLLFLATACATAQVEAHRDEVDTHIGVDQCSDEVAQPNLKLESATDFSGVIKDQTGAPFENSKVQLRIQKPDGTQTPYRTVTTDKQGRFDFGTVAPGTYRLLPAPHRGFKQPDMVLCPRGNCEVNLVIKANKTDQPFAGCPIR